MLKIRGNDILRGGEKIGWLEGNDVRSHEGHKLGYFSGNDIYNAAGRKVAYVEGNHLFVVSGSEKIPLESVDGSVEGAGFSELEKSAVYVLLGA
jgi:hypothetical protein